MSGTLGLPQPLPPVIRPKDKVGEVRWYQPPGFLLLSLHSRVHLAVFAPPYTVR